MDFVTEGSELGIIEPRKIYDIVGDTGIGMWCNAIERGDDIYELIRKSHKNTGLSDVCSRTMKLYGNAGTKELQEQLFSGGKPCLPGSSIKGSIVTAILTSFGEEQIKRRLYGERNNVIDRCFSLKNNPQTSVLRFLRVGDACFDVPTIAIECKSLNIRTNNDDLIDTKGASLSECIYTDDHAQFTIDLIDSKSPYFNDVRSSVDTIATLPKAMYSIENLMLCITNHTKRLLESEIEFWKDFDYPEQDDYISCIKEQIAACDAAIATNGRSAILRLGYGSGYSFITGDWYRKCVDDGQWNDTLTKKIRSDGGRHQDYPYIKTRRVFYEDPDMFPLGFAKIDLVE